MLMLNHSSRLIYSTESRCDRYQNSTRRPWSLFGIIRNGLFWNVRKAISVGFPLLLSFVSAPATADHQPIDSIRLSDFGALCDGHHDDTKAIQNWLQALHDNVRLTAPAGRCLFSLPLTVPFARGYDISGSGPYATTFVYEGASTTSDLFAINSSSGKGDGGASIRDFRITSMTKMTGGYAFHAHGLFASVVSNVVLDGLDAGATGNLCGGYWFDGAGGIDLNTPNAYSRNSCGDGLRVNAAYGGTAELRIIGGNIGGGFINGLHMAGGFGGLRCDGTNIHGNKVNLLIDNASTPRPNREFDQGSTCSFDAAFSDNVEINDPTARGGTVDLAGWIASSQTGNGVHIKHWKNGDIQIRGNKIYNNCLDGIFVEDASTHISVSSFTMIDGNGNAGINAACKVPHNRGRGMNAPDGRGHIN